MGCDQLDTTEASIGGDTEFDTLENIEDFAEYIVD